MLNFQNAYTKMDKNLHTASHMVYLQILLSSYLIGAYPFEQNKR